MHPSAPPLTPPAEGAAARPGYLPAGAEATADGAAGGVPAGPAAADDAGPDFLRSRWDAAAADALDPVARLVYRSNLLGADARITNTGGGNTSAKLTEADPLTGEPVRVLWVKGSGGDLRTATKANFASLRLDQVLGLRAAYERSAERGPKTPAEDAMVAMYAHAAFGGNATAASIDTPLHAFVPHAHVDHVHPVAVIALATAADGPRLTRECYGDDVIWTDWQRPGFDLGLELARVCREHPAARGVILGAHGLINWADDDRACYELTLDLVRRAHRFVEARRAAAPAFGGARVRRWRPRRAARCSPSCCRGCAAG
jgi:rhamnose utilization protein RhaD (predicted bifunctional aldolase and dehydrogenase)